MFSSISRCGPSPVYFELNADLFHFLYLCLGTGRREATPCCLSLKGILPVWCVIPLPLPITLSHISLPYSLPNLYTFPYPFSHPLSFRQAPRTPHPHAPFRISGMHNRPRVVLYENAASETHAYAYAVPSPRPLRNHDPVPPADARPHATHIICRSHALPRTCPSPLHRFSAFPFPSTVAVFRSVAPPSALRRLYPLHHLNTRRCSNRGTPSSSRISPPQPYRGQCTDCVPRSPDSIPIRQPPADDFAPSMASSAPRVLCGFSRSMRESVW